MLGFDRLHTMLQALNKIVDFVTFVAFLQKF
jgi:hypothetical protein